MRDVRKDKLSIIVTELAKKIFYQDLEMRGGDNIPYNQEIIVYANHLHTTDPFAIFSAFLRKAPKDMKQYGLLQPLMRKDFFEEIANKKKWIPNWIVSKLNAFSERSGILLIDREHNTSREGMRELGSTVKRILDEKGSILVYPAKTRSLTGEIFYTKKEYPFSQPIVLPLLAKIDQGVMIPTNYMKDPISGKVIVSFGNPIEFRPYNKQEMECSKKEYKDNINHQILEKIKIMTPVSISHIVASYISELSKKQREVFKVRIEYLNSKIGEIIKDTKGQIETFDNVGTIGYKKEVEEFIYWGEKQRLFQNDRGILLINNPSNILDKDLRKKKGLEYLANQVKHLEPLQRVIDLEANYN